MKFIYKVNSYKTVAQPIKRNSHRCYLFFSVDYESKIHLSREKRSLLSFLNVKFSAVSYGGK